MVILYSIDGEPRQIPESLVDRFLAEGYRRKLPEAQTVEGVENTPQPVDPSLLPINSASLKELIALPMVGTAIAKKVISQRPYSTIEDLIEQVEGVEWMALKDQISF